MAATMPACSTGGKVAALSSCWTCNADSGHAVDNGVGNVPIMGFDAWCANPRAASAPRAGNPADHRTPCHRPAAPQLRADPCQ